MKWYTTLNSAGLHYKRNSHAKVLRLLGYFFTCVVINLVGANESISKSFVNFNFFTRTLLDQETTFKLQSIHNLLLPLSHFLNLNVILISIFSNKLWATW